MIKRKLVFFIALLCFNFSQAADSTCVAHLRLATKLIMEHPDSSKLLCQQVSERCQHPWNRYTQSMLLGGSAWLTGDYSQALSSFHSTIKISDSLDRKDLLSRAYTNLAIIYNDLDFTDLALYYNFLSLELDTASFSIEKANTHNNISTLYEKQHQFDSALFHLTHTRKIRWQLADSGGLCLTYSNYASVYNALKNPAMALAFADSALTFSSVSDKKSVAHAHIERAKAFEKLALRHKLKEELTTLETTDYQLFPEIRLEIHALLFEIYADDNPALSLLHQKKRQALQDSLNLNKARNLGLSLERTIHERQREVLLNKESAATELASELAQSRQNIFLVSLIGTLVLTLLLIFSFRSWKKKTKSKEQELELLRTKEGAEAQAALSAEIERMESEERLAEMREGMRRLQSESTDGQIRHQISRLIRDEESSRLDWAEFKIRFEKIQPHYLESIKDQHDLLSEKDLRLIAMMKLGMNSKEIARISSIKPSSVETHKYRLKKKLNIPKEVALLDYFSSDSL